ncbi:hypothetical protein LTR37_013038 [Vermiconidia calcicola]|uniref:Uncharacterized protein n=1 Tax=Vermiconidia calcicola TaxID=1690605 RepID=A0ACC3MXF2_9PEZI|nr:hypothetical protein LTR37_013038 [Vermiconidia calcicola]
MPATDKEVVFITGANTGIGFQLAKVLLRDHGERFYVIVGSRNASKGETAVRELHDQGLDGCETIPFEVTSDDSISNAATTIEQKFGKLDVLHVNAGIAPETDTFQEDPNYPFSKLFNTCLDTNVAGAAQMAQTFAPVLSKAENPRLIFMSSGLGSLTINHDMKIQKSWPAYAASKAALNMIMLWFWQQYPDWKVNACSPGFRATNSNNFGKAGSAPPTPGRLEDGALNAVRLTLLGKEDGESGTHTSRDDKTGEISTVPW